jgi:hypothetical protein
MKRKNLLLIEKNSTKMNFTFQINNLIGDKKMNITATKSYKVGDQEFTSIEAANAYVAKIEVEAYLKEGVDHIIENSEAFIKSLKALAGIKYTNVGKGNLKDINEHLEKSSSSIVRSTVDWPVYTINTPSESFVIRFVGKVWELHAMIVNKGIDSLKQYKK